MKKRIFNIVLMSFCVYTLSACSNANNIVGKYEADWDKTIYYEFREDGTYSTNYIQGSEDSGEGTYTVDENNYVVTYINGTDNHRGNVGYIYGEHICTMFIGEMPNGNNEVVLTDSLSIDSAYRFEIRFNKNNYKYVFVSDNEEFVISEGTFCIEKKSIICDVMSGQEVKLFLEDDVLYSVEYNKVG